MSERFNVWFDWLMKWEGETYENDPDDRGGETKFGIDKASHPDVDIRNLTRDQAKNIYFAEYWSRVRAEDLPLGVGEVVADIAVNNGPLRAGKWLQEAVGTAQDGVIGRKTIDAANLYLAPQLAGRLIQRREVFYRSIARGSQVKFLRGWLNRNGDLRREFVIT